MSSVAATFFISLVFGLSQHQGLPQYLVPLTWLIVGSCLETPGLSRLSVVLGAILKLASLCKISRCRWMLRFALQSACSLQTQIADQRTVS